MRENSCICNPPQTTTYEFTVVCKGCRDTAKSIISSINLFKGAKGSSLKRSRSEDFNSRLGSSDECRPLQRGRSMGFIVLPELKHDELESFVEFLYTAELSDEKMNKHVYALALAADKYRIPYLLKVCERHLIESLSLSNVLDVLEAASNRSYLAPLKKVALEFIGKNKGDILFSARYI